MGAVLTTPSGSITLGTTPLRIGSDPRNELILNDPLAAPMHAEISAVEDGYQFTDLGSPQGVLINGQILFPDTSQKLQNGDCIVIGASSLVYKVMVADANDVTQIAESARDEVSDVARSREIADQPTDVALPAQPKGATRSKPFEANGALTGDNQSGRAETVPAVIPAAVPEYVVAPTPASDAQTYPSSSAPTSGALVLQAAPQIMAAPAYPLSGGSGYPAVPHFVPVGANSGPLAQPGYPGAYMPGAYAYVPGQLGAVAGVPGKTPAAQKREKMLLWIVVLVVVLLLLGASNVGTYAFARATVSRPVVHTQTFPSPQKALQTFCQGIMTGNAEEIYDLLSDEAKVHTSLDDIQKIFDELKILNNSSGSISAQYSNCGFDDIRTSNSLAVATVVLSITITIELDSQGQKQPQTTTETVPSLTSLVWEHNQWKIDVSSISQQQLKFT